MTTHVFFYGTLMAGFDRREKSAIGDRLTFLGRGWVHGKLYDLGLYPAAVPADDGRIWGELYAIDEPDTVLPMLDDMEGNDQANPDRSLYLRSIVPVTMSDGPLVAAWVYFYNAPLAQARLIPSGDYHDHFKTR